MHGRKTHEPYEQNICSSSRRRCLVKHWKPWLNCVSGPSIVLVCIWHILHTQIYLEELIGYKSPPVLMSPSVHISVCLSIRPEHQHTWIFDIGIIIRVSTWSYLTIIRRLQISTYYYVWEKNLGSTRTFVENYLLFTCIGTSQILALPYTHRVWMGWSTITFQRQWKKRSSSSCVADVYVLGPQKRGKT